ncbi:MAG: putative metal-dependent hydrolase [Chloroflexota bacterium]|nr:MAG: putative metal-dependent hydrolase [Chloroflexota bacterium]
MPTHDERASMIARIRAFPADLEAAIDRLSDEQLDFTPAPGEWSIRQIVHHLGDAHMNGMVRMKWALTEDNPTIKPYDQAGFATLGDSRAPLDMSLQLLRGLHERWAVLMESLDEAQWARPLVHPQNGPMTVETLLRIYADHCDNHLRQIEQNKAAMGG